MSEADNDAWERQQEEWAAAANAKKRKKELESQGYKVDISQSGKDTRVWDMSITMDNSKYGEGKTTVKGEAEGDPYANLLALKDRRIGDAKKAAEFRNKEYFNFRQTYLQSSGGSLLSDTQDRDRFGLVLG